VELQETRSEAMAAHSPRVPRRLDKGLRAILKGGVELAGDHVLLARHARAAPPWRRTTFPTAAYYEGSVNHVHVLHELRTLRAQGNVLGQGVLYARELARLLGSAYPERAFDVWTTGGDDPIVRFHERRDDEGGWESVLDELTPWLGVHVG
jgi:hypothetical protein